MPAIAKMPDIELPEVDLNTYSPKNPVEVPIVENRICTKETSPNYVRHVVFDISGTDLKNNVRIGQSIGILPPGKNERDRPHKLRLYSVASPTKGEDGNPELISTTVKRTIEEFDNNELYLGVCSNYLANLKPGDTVKMTGPSGRRFLLPENAEDFNFIFFATGTGIAPYRGMIKELLDSGITNKIVLVFGCAYRTDLLYSNYFESAEEEYSNFHYLPHVSREARRKDGTKKYVQTCLWDETRLLDPILKQDNTLMYVCGLKGMEAGIYTALGQKNMYQYLDIREPAQDKEPDEWDERDLKRYVKPSKQTFVEVY